jgi:phosphonate transport system substrate-binding protein
VETGAFQGGVLNASIWETRVKNNEVDLTKVEVVWTTPAYYDYHWVIRPDVDQTFGPGTAEKLKAALLKINADHSPEEKAVMDTFQSKSFIPTKNENYTALENVARSLGVIE